MINNSYGVLSANGDSSTIHFAGGVLYFGGTGTFGGGTATLYASFDNGSTYIVVPNSAFTTAGVFSATLPDCVVKLTLAGATSPAFYWVLAQQKPA